MTRQGRYRRVWGFVAGVAAAALGATCSSSTSPHQAASCPTYTGGNPSAASLAGTYTLVSFCQDTVPAFGPAQGVTGTLTLTASPDTFKATVTIPNQAPVNLTGPYTHSHDTIAVSLTLGQFIGTYTFSANTLYVSGNLPAGGTPQPVAVVFFR